MWGRGLRAQPWSRVSLRLGVTEDIWPATAELELDLRGEAERGVARRGDRPEAQRAVLVRTRFHEVCLAVRPKLLGERGRGGRQDRLVRVGGRPVQNDGSAVELHDHIAGLNGHPADAPLNADRAFDQAELASVDFDHCKISGQRKGSAVVYPTGSRRARLIRAMPALLPCLE